MSERKIAIVARSPSTRYDAPFHDESWEIWNLSPMGGPHYSDLPRWERFYEIHNLDEKDVECPGYIDFLNLHAEKVWLRAEHPKCPKANVYPLQKVLDHFDQNFTYPFRYYNNSVTLMMAHAVLEGATEMALYGVDMAVTGEYASQRPSCEVLIGYAAGAGIKVTIPKASDMCKCQRIYGIEEAGPWETKLAIHEEELQQKLNKVTADLNTAKTNMVGASAVGGELRSMLEKFRDDLPNEVLQHMQIRFADLTKGADSSRSATANLEDQLKMLSGALEECRYQRQFS